MVQDQSATKRSVVKPLIILVVIAAVSGLGYFKYYIGTLDYRMKQHYMKGVALMEAGEIGAAAEQFDKAYLTNTQYSALSKSKLIDIINSNTVGAAQAEQVARVFKVHGMRKKPLVDNFFAIGWQKIQEYQTTAPQAAYTILLAIESFATDITALAETREKLLQQWIKVDAENPQPAVILAQLYEAKGDFDNLETILSPHADQLGNSEGARILGQIYAAQNRIQEAYPLLLDYTQERLQAFYLAEKDYQAALDAIWESTLEYLRQGKAPEEFYTSYEVADESTQNAMVQEVYAHNVNTSATVEKKLEAYRKAAEVVPVALDLGMVMLRRAQTLSDNAERKQALQAAENTFLTVKGVAGEDEEYRLYLGQVYYWLGKHEQGRALFDEILATNNRDIGTLYGISNILRELGAESESRELALEAYNKSTDVNDKQALARHLSLLSNKLDDKINWLEKSNTDETDVKAELLRLKGRKAEQSNQRATAAKLYTQAIALYESLPKSATILNNSALIYFELYSAKGNMDDLKTGLLKLDEAIELSPSDSIVLLNAATKHLDLACSEVLGGKLDLNGLAMEGSINLMGYVHYNRQQKRALVDELKSHKSLVKGLSYLEKAMVLSPKNTVPVSMAADVYSFLGDVEGLKLVGGRIKDVSLDLETDKVRQEENISGVNDQENIALYTNQISKYKEQLERLGKAGAKSSQAVLNSYLANYKISIVSLKKNQDFSALIKQARNDYKEFPVYATHRDLSRVLLLNVIENLARSQPEFAALKDQFDRKMNRFTLLAVALETMPGLRGVVAQNSDFKEYVQLLEKEVAQYGVNFSSLEWAIVRYSNPDLAQRLAAIIAQDNAYPIKQVIYKKINIPSISLVYENYWYRLISKQENTADIFIQAKKEGLELPFIPQQNDQPALSS